MVQLHGVQPHRIGHPRSLEQSHRTCGVVGHRLFLLGLERRNLRGQLVLQVGHANVHGQSGQSNLAQLFFGPVQHLAGGQHTHHTHQHGMGGAVELDFAGREVKQGKQAAVGRAG